MKATESISESDIEFESYKTVHDLALNKKVLEPHFEALRILDKPCSEFKEYQKQLSKIRLHNESDHVKIKEEFNNGKLISTTIDTTKIRIDLMPKFPGCENMNLTVDDFDICSKNKLLEYIYGNLKYPKKSRELEVQGKALAQFVISKDGSVINIKVLNGVDSDIKMLVTSILEKMPKWTPGKKDGKPVNVLYTIPIIFKLTD